MLTPKTWETKEEKEQREAEEERRKEEEKKRLEQEQIEQELDEGDIFLGDWDGTLECGIRKYHEVLAVTAKMQQLKEILEKDIISKLKDSGWDHFTEKQDKLKVKLVKKKKTTIDKTALKAHLTTSQIAEVLNTTEWDELELITEQARRKLKNYVKLSEKEGMAEKDTSEESNENS